MLQVNLIGYIGSDAEVKSGNGKEFTTFRVANSERWTGQDGQNHETTIWVDCAMNGRPPVVEFLRKGTLVFVTGSCTLRVYSSPKDKCMKAGMSINVQRVELLGGKTELIPSQLIEPTTGNLLSVIKHYAIQEYASGTPSKTDMQLIDSKGNQYLCDRYGWVTRIEQKTVQP